MAFENVYISKTEGDALGSFNAACIITKASLVHLFNFIGAIASQSCTQQQNISFLLDTICFIAV